MTVASLKQLKAQGFTLLEVLIALACFGFMASTIIYCFLVLNKATVRQRDLSSAKSLCQDRIEEALSTPYDPSNNVIPTLLTAGNTATDTVKVYVRQDNTTTVVSGTRTLACATADVTLKLLQITARVAYTYQGKSYSFQMATLRAPD